MCVNNIHITSGRDAIAAFAKHLWDTLRSLDEIERDDVKSAVASGVEKGMETLGIDDEETDDEEEDQMRGPPHDSLSAEGPPS